MHPRRLKDFAEGVPPQPPQSFEDPEVVELAAQLAEMEEKIVVEKKRLQDLRAAGADRAAKAVTYTYTALYYVKPSLREVLS